MTTPYSRTLFEKTQANTGVGAVAATVPAGKLWVVRLWMLRTTSGQSGFWYRSAPDGTFPIIGYIAQFATATQVSRIPTFEPMQPGEQVQILNSSPSGNVTLWAMGYELTL